MRRRLLAVLLTVVVSGCATGKIEEARGLGVVGGQSSAKLLAAAEAVHAGFNQGLRDDRFLQTMQEATVIDIDPRKGEPCSLIGLGRPDPTATRVTDVAAPVVATINQALQARSDLSAALGKTYAAWGGFASFDTAQTATGVSDLFSAVNSALTAWGASSIPSGVGAVISTATGAYFEQRQAATLKRRSAEVQRALNGYKDALVKGRGPTTSEMENSLRSRYDLTIALWRRGYLHYVPIPNDAAQRSRLVSAAPTGGQNSAANEGLCRAIRRDLEGERDQRLPLIHAEYAAQIAVVDALIKAHRDFETDRPMDAGQLTTAVDRLTALALAISKDPANG